MNASIIHISNISIDTPVHVIGDHYKNSIAPLKSVLSLAVGKCFYVPSGRGGVLRVSCDSIVDGVVTLSHQSEGATSLYRVDLHAPVMSDADFTILYQALKQKNLPSEQRKLLYIAEQQGLVTCRSHCQFGLSKHGHLKAKLLKLS
jgi:hypothetical protein